MKVRKMRAFLRTRDLALVRPAVRARSLRPRSTVEVVRKGVLDLAEVDRQIELFRTRSAADRQKIAGVQPKRAEVILAGACIVRSVLGKLRLQSVTVSDRGLRHRIFVERF